MASSASAAEVEQVFGDGEVGATENAPVSTKDRIGSLDFIRGIAVMGILAANIIAFGQPFNAYIYPEAFIGGSGDPDGWMWIAQFVLVDGKMRGLFTLLFGAGMYLFMERAWARGSSRWLQMWRLFLLLCFGLIHFFFIWIGDILFFYGLIGFLAVACLRWTAKAQLWVGLIGYIFGALLLLATMSFPYIIADTSAGDAEQFSELRVELQNGIDEALADDARTTELKQSGDYAGLVEKRISEEWYLPLANAALFIFETLPLMLIGMALYRFGFFSGVLNRSKMIMWGWIGLISGGLVHLAIGLFARSEGFTFYVGNAAFIGWSPLPRIAMVLGLTSLMVAYSPAWTG